jgi:hypothetical protein
MRQPYGARVPQQPQLPAAHMSTTQVDHVNLNHQI